MIDVVYRKELKPMNLSWLVFDKFPAANYMPKVNNGNTRTKSEICSKLIIKTPERQIYCLLWTYFTPCSSLSIVNFGQINTDWVGVDW